MTRKDINLIAEAYKILNEQNSATSSQTYAVFCGLMGKNVFIGSALGTNAYTPSTPIEEIVKVHLDKFTKTSSFNSRGSMADIDSPDFSGPNLDNKTYVTHLDDMHYLFVSQDFNDIIRSITSNLLEGDYSEPIDVEGSLALGEHDVDFDTFAVGKKFIDGCQNILKDALNAVKVDTINEPTQQPYMALMPRAGAKACEFALFVQDGSGQFKSNNKRSVQNKSPVWWPRSLMKIEDETIGLANFGDESDLQTRAGYLPED